MNTDQKLTSTALENLYNAKCYEFVDNVLKESANDFEREHKLTDKTLLNLYNVFGVVFERALELYEQERVTYIFPSETTTSTAGLKDQNNVRHLVQIKGLSGALYTLFPDVNYCTCASFRCQVLTDKSILTCKHVLAAWLASITKEKLSYQHITEKQFLNLLSYQVSYG